jgi:hypothetical protein
MTATKTYPIDAARQRWLVTMTPAGYATRIECEREGKAGKYWRVMWQSEHSDGGWPSSVSQSSAAATATRDLQRQEQAADGTYTAIMLRRRSGLVWAGKQLADATEKFAKEVEQFVTAADNCRPPWQGYRELIGELPAHLELFATQTAAFEELLKRCDPIKASEGENQ